MFQEQSPQGSQVPESLATLAAEKESTGSRLTRNPLQIPRHEETVHPFATKKQRCVYVKEVSKRGRPGSSVGKYYTHIFMCANSNSAVHYKFIFIKTHAYSVKGTEKISVPRSIMGDSPSLHQSQMIILLLPS